MPAPATHQFSEPSFQIALGAEKKTVLTPGLPVLAGRNPEVIFAHAVEVEKSGSFRLFQEGDWLIGAGSSSISLGIEAATQHLYREMFRAARNRYLVRIWNYLPQINALTGVSGIENYHAFCRGRSLEFEANHGADFSVFLPAASAVGTDGEELNILFAACPQAPRHLENPKQIPAYLYPSQYGPRSPSFARATIARTERDEMIFISGTSAISGHATVAPGETALQLENLIENLKEICRGCGLSADEPTRVEARQFKVYLRHAHEQQVVADVLEKKIFRPADTVCYLRSDICRSELNIEIELTVRRTTNG